MPKNPPRQTAQGSGPKKKLTGADRAWQEWKRRHPKGTRADFQRFVNGNPSVKKALTGNGKVRMYGFEFTKTGAKAVAGAKAAARRAAGAASGLAPTRFSQSGKLSSYKGLTRMDPALARQYERQIRSFFQGRGSPLARYARNFVVAGDISGFDPRFLAAISVWETGAGTAITYPQTRPFNFWNWNNTDSGAVGADAPWQNVDTAFKYYAEQFGGKYRGSNLYQDFGSYATNPTWEAKIGGTLRQMGGNPYDVRWAPPRPA